jgi:polyhydroxyalkanoate synthase
MPDQPDTDTPIPGPDWLAGAMAGIAERSQKMVTDFLARQQEAAGEAAGKIDPLNIGDAFFEMTARMMADPARMFSSHMSLWQDHLALWQSTGGRMMGQDIPVNIEPEEGDRRFKDDAWRDNEVFNFIKQSYLLTSRWLQSTAGGVKDLDGESARKVDFYTRQFVDALSPRNFVLTNPEVLRATLESGGENLVNGLGNLLQDLEHGKGSLDIKRTDDRAFELGRNIAVTPGKVVFRNQLMELIQYAPSTDRVLKRPLLIITPWINKFYILDLRPENSLIKWAVDRGHTVFVTSWVNPDEKLAAKTFADYMVEGPLVALDAIADATGESDVNAVGYCIGGTLLACALATLAARGDKRVKTATFFASMVDFSEPGDLGVFIDEAQLSALEKRMNERGYLEGNEMGRVFNMMRGNDLTWSFVINNYLLGRDPFPFDLLYWNADSTRMPAAMHGFYLRQMYLENKLAKPGGLSLAGTPIDLRRIETPAYIVATREDHIAPWKSTYAATGLYSGPSRFVLAASGHIAGIVNAPAKKKYCHWTNAKTPATPEDWLAGAAQKDGSWWPDWDKWLKRRSGKTRVAARIPGSGKLKALCEAPGEYVKTRAD